MSASAACGPELLSSSVSSASSSSEVSSLSALVRMLRAGVHLASFAEPFAAMPDLGLALVPYRRRFVRGQAGAVYHRSLERYGPAVKLVELVEAAALRLRR